MSCNECRQHVRGWLRGELSDADAVEVQDHVSKCYFCAAVVENEATLLDGLHRVEKIPAPTADFKQRVLSAASEQDIKRTSHKPALGLPAMGGAIAAALALGIALGVGFGVDRSSDSGSPDVAEAVAPEKAQNVRLAFNSAQAMDNVTLTVELPPHVEMARYPGHQQLSWSVSLDKGENIVELPLKVLFPGEGDLVAHLDNGKSRKTFRAHLAERDVSSSSEPVL